MAHVQFCHSCLHGINLICYSIKQRKKVCKIPTLYIMQSFEYIRKIKMQRLQHWIKLLLNVSSYLCQLVFTNLHASQLPLKIVVQNFYDFVLGYIFLITKTRFKNSTMVKAFNILTHFNLFMSWTSWDTLLPIGIGSSLYSKIHLFYSWWKLVRLF